MTMRCLDCNEEISGRRDKKFCNDQCRINYHNIIAQERNKGLRKINSILLKNRKILEELFLAGKSEISRSQLQNAGFNFKYHTHLFRLNGKLLTVSYDYAISFQKTSGFKIICLTESQL
jgi:hypothetical protein